ncbi:hypothetical protein BK126_08045 [Paenibacillus sp. FSL H7-0326]|nr:hypothetical protein BK126_08045 [Paenibacillus sp. FSL H7-0326]SDX32144.1 hypothetical protein SAMN05518848_106185 [Paenibacillus sp. PDC88]
MPGDLSALTDLFSDRKLLPYTMSLFIAVHILQSRIIDLLIIVNPFPYNVLTSIILNTKWKENTLTVLQLPGNIVYRPHLKQKGVINHVRLYYL